MLFSSFARRPWSGSLIGPLSLALGTWLAASSAQARIETFFSPASDLGAIGRVELSAAKRSIDAMLPDLSDHEMLAQLSKLARTGKRIRILTRVADQKACAPCQTLERAGVDVRLIAPAVLHHVAIVDGPRNKKDLGEKARLLIVGDGVDPRSGVLQPHHLIVARSESDLVLAYQDEFNFLWSRASDFRSKARHAQVFAVKRPMFMPALFSSTNMLSMPTRGGFRLNPSLAATEGVVAEHITAAFDHAYDRIDISATSVGRSDIRAALLRALNRGVKVRILLPEAAYQKIAELKDCRALNQRDAKDREFQLSDECLVLKGAEVRYLATGPRGGEAPVAHFMIVDGRRLLTGNFGLDEKAESASLGSLMSMRGPEAQAFQTHFDTLFDSQPSRNRNDSSLVSYPERRDDCAFAPRAVAGETLAALQAIVQDGACRAAL